MVPHDLLVVLHTGEVQHLYLDAGLLEYRRDLQDA